MNISISKLRLFKSCRRAYEFRYVEKLNPIRTSEALQTGLSYHEKLESLYKDGTFDESDLSKTSAMASAYKKYIYPEFEVKLVEEWFEYELSKRHTLIGRIDGLVEGNAILEHKTTSMNLDAYEFDLEWDEQILAYMLACGTNRMVYTMVRKPTIRQKKDEADEDFYQRMVEWYDDDTYSKIRFTTVMRTENEIADFKKHLVQMCDEMERAEDLGLLYKNPAYCHHWNTMCEYAQICNDYDLDKVYVNFERSGK